MTPTTLTIGSGLGGIAILNTKTVNRDRLYWAADNVNCGQFVPAQPARTTVLRDCMKDVADSLYGRIRRQPNVVRQLDDPASFEVVRVVPGQSQNEYRFLFSALIGTNWDVGILEYDSAGPRGSQVLASLDPAVVQQRDYLPSSVVGQVAVKMLRHWKATPLKDDGGVWFMLGQTLEDFRTFASLLLGPHADGPRFTVHQVEIASDPDTVMHVLDRLGSEVQAGLAEIMTDVMEATGGMADRSINVRINRADRFLEKVRLYEQVLGRPLPELTSAIDQVKQAVAVNRLLAAAV
jgi:hypothetical protein